MKKLMFVPLLFLFLISPVCAQQVTIGVSPAKVDIDFSTGPRTTVVFTFSNTKGDVNAEYYLIPDDVLKDYVVYEECENDYWCGAMNPFIVPKGGSVQKEILFMLKPEGERPELLLPEFATGGTVGVLPRVKVSITIHDGQVRSGGLYVYAKPVVNSPETTTTVKHQETSSRPSPPLTTTTQRTTTSQMATTVSERTPIPPPSPSPTSESLTQGKGEPIEPVKMSFNPLFLLVPLLGAGIVLFVAWFFDLPPITWFIFLLFLIPIVRAGDVSVGVTVSQNYTIFYADEGITRTMNYTDVIDENYDIFITNHKQEGNHFTYYITNNNSDTMWVHEIVLSNPLKEYRVSSISATYRTDSGEEIPVFVTRDDMIHVKAHSLIPIESSSGSNVLELNFFVSTTGIVVGLLPLLTAVGIVLMIVRSLFESPGTVEDLIKIVLTIVVSIVLLVVMVATI